GPAAAVPTPPTPPTPPTCSRGPASPRTRVPSAPAIGLALRSRCGDGLAPARPDLSQPGPDRPGLSPHELPGLQLPAPLQLQPERGELAGAGGDEQGGTAGDAVQAEDGAWEGRGRRWHGLGGRDTEPVTFQEGVSPRPGVVGPHLALQLHGRA